MSLTGLEAFDRTVHKTNAWLSDLMQCLGWHDRPKAYRALKATLRALRDRLTLEEVAQLGAQLPMLVRGFYYEQWDPTHTPRKERHRQEFLARIEHELAADDDVDAEQIARAVFSVLEARVAEGEIEDVKQVLPADIRELWPARAPA
jgi:uncharacterized protein (DUF2267 family)